MSASDRPVSAENVSLSDLRRQVADQARAMAHMASQIYRTYDALAVAYASSNNAQFLCAVGRASASRLEVLGDMMNDMDIVTDEDSWVDPILKEAQRLWPQKKVR